MIYSDYSLTMFRYYKRELFLSKHGCFTTGNINVSEKCLARLETKAIHPLYIQVDIRQKAEQEGESSQEEEEEAKPVMVKFARHETEEAKARRYARQKLCSLLIF